MDPGAPAWQLSVGEQQRVEILKMLYRGVQVLIMDEPTAVLAPQEIEGLFTTLRAMVASRPRTADALLAVPGMGPVRLERFGADLLRILADGAP